MTDKNGKLIKVGDQLKINVDGKIMGNYTEYYGEHIGIITEHCFFGEWTPVFESISNMGCLVLPLNDMSCGEIII